MAENGQKTFAWRTVVGILLSLISFVGAWIFYEVAGMPETYATKADVSITEGRMSEKIDIGDSINRDRTEQLQKNIQRDLDQILKMQMHAQESIDEINKYLLHGSEK